MAAMMEEEEDQMIKEEVEFEEEDIEGYSDVVIVSCEEADADKAGLAWKEAAKLADAARQYANRMQFAAAKAVGLAQDLEAVCATAKSVAQRTAHLAETAFWKKRKHEEQEEARKAAMMDEKEDQMIKEEVEFEEEDIEGYSDVVIVSCEEADADKAGLAWKEAAKLADAARQYANRMQFAAAKAVGLAQDLEAVCATAKSVAQRTAHLAETAFWKKRKHEEQEEARKKRMPSEQEEARKRNDEEARKRQQVATSSSSSSSTRRNQQQQKQHRLRPRPPDHPPPRPWTLPSAKWSPPPSKCKM